MVKITTTTYEVDINDIKSSILNCIDLLYVKCSESSKECYEEDVKSLPETLFSKAKDVIQSFPNDFKIAPEAQAFVNGTIVLTWGIGNWTECFELVISESDIYVSTRPSTQTKIDNVSEINSTWLDFLMKR